MGFANSVDTYHFSFSFPLPVFHRNFLNPTRSIISAKVAFSCAAAQTKWSSQNKPPGLSTLYTSNIANSSITPEFGRNGLLIEVLR